MLRPFIPFLLFTLCMPAFVRAQIDLSETWTDGNWEYTGREAGNGGWQFEGGDTHEGGFKFTLKKTGDSTYLVTTGSIVKQGNTVVYRVVDGHRVLIVKSSVTGLINDIFIPMKRGQELRDLETSNKIDFELAGEYIDTRNGKPVIFSLGRPEVKGLLGASAFYDFATAYDNPEDVLVFDSRKINYYYVRTDSSLELFEAVGNGIEEYEKGKKEITLRRTGWVDPTGSRLPGRYGFASVILLTPFLLRNFTPAELRIMRNEIYARHGYIFKSPELKAWFTAQPWYKPVEGAGEAQLSELEKLNVQTISAGS